MPHAESAGLMPHAESAGLTPHAESAGLMPHAESAEGAERTITHIFPSRFFDFTVCDFTTFFTYWSGESLKIMCTESWHCEEEGSCKIRVIEGAKGGFGGEEAKVQIVGKVWEMQKWAFNPLTRPSGSCILACVATRLGGSAPHPPRKKSSKTVNDFPRSCVYGG